MEHSESMAEIAKALAKAQDMFPDIPKTKEGKVEGQGKGGNNYSFTYKYADLADVVPAVVPVLESVGLSFAQFPDVNDRGDDGLTTMILHESGEWISGFMRLYLAKTTSQGHGSAITYARRYALCAALGIVADEDDDGQTATQQQAQQTPRPKPQNSGRASRPASPKAPAKPVADLIAPLSQDQRKEIADKMVNANFPESLDDLNNAQQTMVRRWIENLTKGAAA